MVFTLGGEGGGGGGGIGKLTCTLGGGRRGGRQAHMHSGGGGGGVGKLTCTLGWGEVGWGGSRTRSCAL